MLLEIKNLWHSYKSPPINNWILKNVNLGISKGELVGFLGPSGCGKTTLLRLIAGFEKPLKGSISFSGINISSKDSILPPERRGIGMVFQDYALFPHMDVWQNVCFGFKKGQDKKRASWLLDLLDIYKFKDCYPHELSGGQRQRVALARALAPGNSLVVLDEPFCSLDVQVRNKLRNKLSSVLRSCSATGILVTHDPDEALAICDRVVVMREGEIHQMASPSEIVHKPSTPFVGGFVMRKNILPTFYDGIHLITPLGKISGVCDVANTDISLCMFDINILSLELTSTGEGKVLSKEYHIKYWIITVQILKYQLRVIYDINSTININDKCNLKFKKNQEIILFPGCIRFSTI